MLLLLLSYSNGQANWNKSDIIKPSSNEDAYISLSILSKGSSRLVDKIRFNRFTSEYAVDLSRFSTNDKYIDLKIEKEKGKRLFFDTITLSGNAPVLIDGLKESSGIDTLSKEDKNLFPLEKGEMILRFKTAGKKILRIVGRSESQNSEVIPFVFPVQNRGFKREAYYKFYSYDLKTGVRKEIFREFITTSSGHPAGYTSAYAYSDENYFYLTLDFTSDNTRDGEEDYASIILKRGDERYEYFIRENYDRWGSVEFISTKEANYPHKVYKFRIPRSEIKSDVAEFALTAYGTATSGVFTPKIAFSERKNQFLSVYTLQNTSNNGLYGVIFDRKGNAKTPFLINNLPITNVEIAYNRKNDVFLLVYPHCEDGCNLYGEFLSSDGKPSGNQIIISKNLYGFGDIVVESDESENRFLVVWRDNRNRSAPDLYGNFVNLDGTINSEVVIVKNAVSISGFDIVKDSVNNRFLFVYSNTDINGYGVFLEFLDSSLNSSGNTRIVNTNDYACRLSVSYNDKEKLFFIAYTDFTAGVDAYNIIGLILDENLNVLANSNITKDSNRNRYPVTDYNPYLGWFLVAFQRESLQNNTSNIILNGYDSNMKIQLSGTVDDTNRATLLQPSLSTNRLCPNHLLVFIDYENTSGKNSLGSKLFGDVCKFALNILKSGDGTGKVTSSPAGIICGSVCNYLFDDGEAVTLTAVPDESSLFASYSGTNCVDEPVCSVLMDSDKDIGVEFILKTFQITTTYGNGGKIIPENPSVKYGSDQTFEIVPDSGYSIEDVLVDNVSVGKVTSYTLKNITSSHSISAIFRQEQQQYYTITATASEGGTISPSGEIEVSAGESLTFQINPSNGYYIDYVEVDSESVGNVSSYTFNNVDKNHTIYAKFSPYLNEWEMDSGVVDTSNEKDIPATITETRDKESGCGCTLLE